MSFFDKLGSKIQTTSKDIAQKAKDMAEVSNLNNQIQSEEDNIQRLYTQIGKEYYIQNKSDEGSVFAEKMGTITESFEKIEALKKEIQAIKGARECKNCGAQIPESSGFCTECGTKVEVEQAEPVTGAPVSEKPAKTAVCSGCGKEYADGVAFCGECGESVVPVSTPEEGTVGEEAKEILCSNCGHQLSADTRFCMECGTKVEE